MNRKSPVSVVEPATCVRFLKAVEKLGCVSAAAALTGIPVRTFYRLRQTDEAFADAWDDAILIARGDLEDLLRRRFTEGVDYTVRRNGRDVTVTRKFSDRLGVYVHQVLERRAQKIELQRASEGQKARQEAQRIETIEPLELARRILYLLRDAAGKVCDSGDAAAIAEVEQMLLDAGFRPNAGS
jgi:hypothetical protein